MIFSTSNTLHNIYLIEENDKELQLLDEKAKLVVIQQLNALLSVLILVINIVVAAVLVQDQELEYVHLVVDVAGEYDGQLVSDKDQFHM